jgi:hypothetical protein
MEAFWRQTAVALEVRLQGRSPARRSTEPYVSGLADKLADFVGLDLPVLIVDPQVKLNARTLA